MRCTPHNRAEAFALITTGLAKTSAMFSEMRALALSKCREYLAAGKVSQLSVRAGSLFFDTMGLAVTSVLRGEAQGWEQVRRAFAQMYWALEISQHDWLQQGLAYPDGDRVADPAIPRIGAGRGRERRSGLDRPLSAQPHACGRNRQRRG